ncbi:DUF4411 domain-containing protein [Candidatus Poribacteria bacterium]|nr:MAG: DUF4411 domain-containing protein [Candidatus Poribacteria bacterium]
MIYVFDTNSFSVLGNYYPNQFPTFWQYFDQTVQDGRIISVREVYRELQRYTRHSHLSDWIERHKSIFVIPGAAETQFVSQIFMEPRFQNLVNEKNRLAGYPCADPFIIALAKTINGYVVTEEKEKPNAPNIPNVCDHFGVAFTNLQGFMEREKWTF